MRAAVSAHPWLVGGTGSADTALIEGSRDPETQSSRIIAKVGADGWHAAILADHVVVVKCRSGNQQPALVALVWVLAQLGAQCADLLPPPVIENDAGEPVGEYRVLS